MSSEPEFRVLSSDPGTRNYGVAVVRLKRDEIRVIGTGMFTRTLTSLVGEDFEDCYARFETHWGKILSAYTPDESVAERYQTRGINGLSIELISTMNGSLATICSDRKIPTTLYIAGQWKQAFHKCFTHGEKPRDSLEWLYDQVGVPPHRVDAALIGIYHILGRTFEDFEITPKLLDGMRQQLRFTRGAI